jgi:ABC-type lipoprotein export system ATPase subunit/GNAT superfamily N-acetyltransferase
MNSNQLDFVDTWLPMTRTREVTVKVTLKKTALLAAETFDYDPGKKPVFVKYDVPNLPETWNIGLIVGNSGTGKSTLLEELSSNSYSQNVWDKNKSIADHFENHEIVSELFYAVGLSSVPTWLKPHHVLSTGEKYRADLAMSLGSQKAFIDEFTSTVDRTVAKASSISVANYIKQKSKQVVFATCHRDIIPYLKPDWIIDTDAGMYCHNPRECLQREPMVVKIYEVKRPMWNYFMGHHYLTQSLHPFARCYIATVSEEVAAFGSSIPFPHGHIKKAWRETRTVTLPDFQGMGIGVRLSDWIAEAHVRGGYRYFSRTTHHRMGEYRMRHKNWKPTSSNRKKQTPAKDSGWGRFGIDSKRIAYSHEFILEEN